MITTLTDTTAESNTPIRPLRIAVRLFDAREHWHLSRTLEMGGRMAGCAIELEVPAGSADIVFVAPDEPGADAMLQRRVGQSGPIPVAYTADPLPGLRCLPRPARVQDVRALLADLARDSAGAAPVAVANPDAPAAPAPAELPFAVAEMQSLLVTLQGARRSGEAFARHGANGQHVLFVPRQQKVFCTLQAGLEELAESLRGVADGDVEPLSGQALAARLEAGRFHALPLEAMAWQLAMLAPPRQPGAIAAVPRLRLRRWPNFALLPHRPQHLQWAAALARQPRDVATLLARAPGAFDPFARFANACSVLGILELHPAPVAGTTPAPAPAAAAAVPDARSGIFRKLLARLAG